LAAGLAAGDVTAVEVTYGGKNEEAARPVLVAALEGLLAGLGQGPVSLVNAPVLAEERGIRLTRRSGAPEPGFETSIGVKVETRGGRVRVAGALVGNSHGRVIRIDEYHVDVAPEGWLLVVRNRDVPGVIGRVGTMLGESGVNIASWHQGRDAGEGEALAAITVDQPPGDEVRARLAKLPDILEVRVANFGE
jgi:L-serine deaminase